MSNYIENTIKLSLEVSKRSNVPVLFLSNPGCGKTTNINNYAKEHNMGLVELVGAQRVREDILGYMINDNGTAGMLKPDWFNDLWAFKKEGKETILFIDELSTAPEDVQGALLQLIFGRKIGGLDNYLPEDCLIVSAANFKGNLPGQFNIMAPTLNRFMLVNLEPKTSDSLIDEFLGLGIKQKEFNFSTNEISDEQKIKIKTDLGQLLKNVCSQFVSAETNGENYISVKSKDLDGLYEAENEVYNFISGRTISYLERITQALVSIGRTNLDLSSQSVKDQISNMIFGLIGAGTGNFTTNGTNFRKEIFRGYMKMLDAISSNLVISDEDFTALDYSKLSVGQSINEFTLRHTSIDKHSAKYLDFIALHTKICERYLVDNDRFSKLIQTFETDNKKAIEFQGDMNKLDGFIMFLEGLDNSDVTQFVQSYKQIQKTFKSYKEQLGKR